MTSTDASDRAARLARWIFGVAGVYGILVLTPMFFLESQIGRDHPPPITHSEYFYGFIGVAVAWQAVFLVVARDPRRFRPLMIPAVLEKISWAAPTSILFWQGRLAAAPFAFGMVDLALGVLFTTAYVRLGRAPAPADR